MKRPTPLDSPRDFRINEMFFSTTDRAGKILSGNDVFVRVSGYTRGEMIGRPHNLIRHPDMPRGFFRLVWDYLLKDRAVAGFVKNMACDGRHYWVVALLMPIRGRFLSIRFKPSSPLQPVVEGLYRQMVACEQEQQARGADGPAAMAASETLLVGALRERGFDSYEAFMRTLLHEELKSRDAAVGAQRLLLFPELLGGVGLDGPLGGKLLAIYNHGRAVYTQINALYGQLDEFVLLNEKIGGKSARVLEQTADFRFIAFNAALRASRLGEEARSLGVIADYLGTASAGTAKMVSGLAERIVGVSAKLRAVIFNLAAARLQIEMVLSFCAELASGAAATGEDARIRCEMIADLQLAFAATSELAVSALLALEQELSGLGATSEDLRRIVLALQVAQIGGLVEASRLRDDDSFAVMFTDLRVRVEATKLELGDLNDIADRLAQLAEKTPGIAAAMAAAVRQMEHEVQELGGTHASAKSAVLPASAAAGNPETAQLTAA